MPVNMDKASGKRGLDQIMKSLLMIRIGARQSEITGETEDAIETYERHSKHFQERCSFNKGDEKDADVL